MSNQEDHMLQSQELKASNQIQLKQTGNTRKNNKFKLGSTHNKHYSEITKYDKKIYGKNGRNV